MGLLQHTFQTPVGEMTGIFSSRGVCMLDFCDRAATAREHAAVEKAKGCLAVPGASALSEHLADQLVQYFSGERQCFDVPLDMVGTAFERKVWESLLRIPYGNVWTYLQQARQLGHPTAVRAVAAANGRNKLSILVPCHRVIGSNGRLTGYGGGLQRKQYLFELEGVHAFLA